MGFDRLFGLSEGIFKDLHIKVWLSWFKVVDGELNGPVAKFLTGIQEELTTALALEDKDLVLFVADTLEVANATLGALRGRIAKELGLIDNDKFNFLWVVDWPMFEWSEEEGRYMSAHHPFTLPLLTYLPDHLSGLLLI